MTETEVAALKSKLVWRAIDLLVQIVLRSHIASKADRDEWERLVKEKRDMVGDAD